MNTILILIFFVSLFIISRLVYISRKRNEHAKVDDRIFRGFNYRDFAEEVFLLIKKISHVVILFSVNKFAYYSHKLQRFIEGKFPEYFNKQREQNEKRILSFFVKSLTEYKQTFKNIKKKIVHEEKKKELAEKIAERVSELQIEEK